MKKISLLILMAGFAITANAQNQTEETGEVSTECIPEEAQEANESYEKKRKKHQAKMARVARKDTEKESRLESPYAFAKKE